LCNNGIVERERERETEKREWGEGGRESTIYMPLAPNWSRYVQGQFLDLKST